MKKLLIICFILINSLLNAATYYIDPAGADGVGNTGAIDDPWLTLSHAVSHCVSGDSVHVNAGTYIFTSAVNVGVGISIVGVGNTSLFHSHIANPGAMLYFDSAAGNPTDGNQSISFLQFDGDALTGGYAISASYRNNVKIHDCTITNFLHKGIKMLSKNTAFEVAPSNNYATGNEIYNCIISNCSGTADGDGVIAPDAQEGLLIYNNTITNTGRASNGDIFKGTWLRGCKIYDNILTTTEGDNGTAWNFTSELFFLMGVEFYNNVINGAGTLNFVDATKDTYNFGFRIYNNQFLVSTPKLVGTHGTVGIAIEERGGIDNVYIYNNYIKNQSWGISVLSTANAEHGSVDMNDIYIYNNVLENIGALDQNWGFGINISSGNRLNPYITTWDNINIWNNTITGRESGLNTLETGIRLNLIGYDVCTNFNIRNNIIKTAFDYAISISEDVDGTASLDILSIENNNYYGCGHSNTINNIVATTNLTNQNNITSDPLFVSSTNLHLQSTSLAKDAGINVGITTDYAGHHRPYNSIPDIGAYEWGQRYLMNNSKIVMNNGKIVKIEQ